MSAGESPEAPPPSPRARLPPHFFTVGAAAAVFYLLVEWSFASLAEFDSFYHVGLARLYLEHGFVREFPWMSLSVLRDRFNDPQLLLHLLMMPFLGLGVDPTVAGKLVGVIAAVGLSLSFYWFLWRQQARLAIAWTLVWMGASSYCIARLTFVKTTALFLALTLFFLEALFEGRTRRLLVLSALAVWTYQGFPLLGVVALLYLGLRVLAGEDRFRFERLAPILGGFLLGMLVNPFFPNDLYFFHFEIVQQILLKPKELALGAEWGAIDSAKFLSTTFLPLLALISSEMVATLVHSPVSARHLFLRVVAFLLLFGALVSSRLIEYFVPFALLAAASTFSRAIEAAPARAPARLIWGLALFLCLPAAAFNAKEGIRIATSIAKEIDPASYQRVAAWLAANTAEDELVISQWDDFPMLFFYDRRNRYPFGLNVAYGYGYDPTKFLVHQLLFEGRIQDPETFLEQVNARCIVVARSDRYPGRQALAQGLAAHPRFERVFSTGTTHVFRLKPAAAAPPPAP